MPAYCRDLSSAIGLPKNLREAAVTQKDQFFIALIGRLVALRYAQERLLESIRECKGGPEEDERKASDS